MWYDKYKGQACLIEMTGPSASTYVDTFASYSNERTDLKGKRVVEVRLYDAGNAQTDDGDACGAYYVVSGGLLSQTMNKTDVNDGGYPSSDMCKVIVPGILDSFPPELTNHMVNLDTSYLDASGPSGRIVHVVSKLSHLTVSDFIPKDIISMMNGSNYNISYAVNEGHKTLRYLEYALSWNTTYGDTYLSADCKDASVAFSGSNDPRGVLSSRWENDDYSGGQWLATPGSYGSSYAKFLYSGYFCNTGVQGISATYGGIDPLVAFSLK